MIGSATSVESLPAAAASPDGEPVSSARARLGRSRTEMRAQKRLILIC